MKKGEEKDGKVVISIWIDKELADKIDHIVDKVGITRSKFLSNTVEVVVHDLMITDKMGFLSLAKFYNDMRDAIKNMGIKQDDKKIMPKLFSNK